MKQRKKIANKSPKMTLYRVIGFNDIRCCQSSRWSESASQAFPVFARSTGAAISSRFTTVGIWESSHHPFGVRSFFSYFIFVFSIWFVSNGSVGWKESRRLLLQNEKKPCLRYFFRILPVKSCHSDHFRRYFFVRRYYRLCLIYMNGRLLLSSTGRWWWLVNQCPTLVRWGKPKSNGEKKFFLKRKKKILKASPLSLFLSFALLLWWRFSTM